MEQQTLQDLIDQGLSLAKIAAHQKCSQGSVRHWLKRYGLRTRRGPRGKLPKDMPAPRKCSCGETDPTKFYGHKRSVCGACTNQYNLRRGREQRERVVRHMGGKCAAPECGFDKYPSALQIHHSNPETKDPSFSSYRGWNWERLVVELEQCILLCACCHMAFHAGELEPTWV
jgi:hypothetical protein